MNILSTIPLSKHKDWTVLETALKLCSDGHRFHLINTVLLPKNCKVGDFCYLIWKGQIRGYMDIVDMDLSENYRNRHGLGKPRTTHCIVLANWRPITPVDYTGFQGWRYTHMRP